MNKFSVVILIVFGQAFVVHYLNAQDKPTGQTVTGKTAAAPSEINRIEKNMVFVEGDTFTMGCLSADDTDCHDNELPAHKVRVNSFYINKYDVTVRDFALFVNETGYQTDADKQGFSNVFSNGAFNKKYGINWRSNANGNVCTEAEKNNPVVHISWNDAQAFCQWLSTKTGKKFRLATEAEFEFAAKGGRKTHGYKFAGGVNLDSVGWYNANCGDSSLNPVGKKRPNELGLYDMSGNVWQLCNDWYGKTYYIDGSINNPQGPDTGTYIMVRGGSWRRDPPRCRVTSRHWELPDGRHTNLGFRVAEEFKKSGK